MGLVSTSFNSETGAIAGAISKRKPLDREWLEKVEAINSDTGRSDKDEIYLELFKEIRDGNVKAAEVILDRIYGKPKQPVSIDVNQKAQMDIQAGHLDKLTTLEKIELKRLLDKMGIQEDSKQIE